MIRQTLALACLLSAGAPSAWAQVHVQIEIGLPPVPRLVVIQPGLQVVEGFQEEVFFHNGWYWCRRHDGWYRARSPRARFGWVEARRVPRVLVQVPTGHYRNWHHDRGVKHWEARGHERREERREEHRKHRRKEPRGDRDRHDHRREH